MTPLELSDSLYEWHDYLSNQLNTISLTWVTPRSPNAGEVARVLPDQILARYPRGISMAIRDYITENFREQLKGGSPAQITALAEAGTSIKVIGIGSAGCNRIRSMIHSSNPPMTFAMVNTDDSLLATNDPRVVAIDIDETKARAWESGGVQELAGTDGSTDRLRQFLSGSDLVFVTAGMGGSIGTGVVPYVARVAREQGALVLGFVTAPFSFEGRRRMGQAVAGIDRLRPLVDNSIVIHNDRLSSPVKWEPDSVKAFRMSDEVATEGIMGLSDLINVSQKMSVDFSDIKQMMKHRGRSLMSIGRGSKTNGPMAAAIQAVDNPLLDLSIEHAASVLIVVKGRAAALTLSGINAARQVVADAAPNAEKIMVSVRVDDAMGEDVNLILLATGIRQTQTESTQRVDQADRTDLLAGGYTTSFGLMPIGVGQRTLTMNKGT